MNDDTKALDDYVAAMHVMVQNGQALQSGRKAFVETKDSLDTLIAEQRQIGSTLTSQSNRLDAALAALEAQDLNALEQLLRGHAEEAARRDADIMSHFGTASDMAVASLHEVGQIVKGQGEESVKRDVAVVTAFQTSAECLSTRMGAVESELMQSSQRLDDFRMMLRQHIEASEQRQRELSQMVQELTAVFTESQRQGVAHQDELLNRLKGAWIMLVIILLGVLGVVLLQFLR